MFRYKKTFGDKLLSRNFDNQKTENIIKINLLNKFTSLGMPESWPIYGQIWEDEEVWSFDLVVQQSLKFFQIYPDIRKNFIKKALKICQNLKLN